MSDPTETPDGFQKLQRQFIQRCGRDAATLAEIAEKDALEPDRRQALARIAHSLAGAGGTFGFADISTAASALEDLLASDKPPDKPDVVAKLQTLITVLNRATSS